MFTGTICSMLKVGLRFLNIWPGVRFVAIFRLAYLLIAVPMQYCQYLYTLTHLNVHDISEFEDLVDSLPTTVNPTFTIFKLVSLWINRRIVYDLMATMDADWRECVKNDQNLHVMSTKASISKFCTHFLTIFNMSVGLVYFFGGYALNYMQFLKDGNETSRPFPMKIIFPFDSDVSPIYELLVAAVFVHMLLNLYLFTTLNAMILTLVFHASGQIDIVCEEFRTISEKISYYESSGKAMGMLVERHHKVITFSENLERIFSVMALLQIFSNCLVAGALAILAITCIHNQSGVVSIVRTVFGCSIEMTEIFIFCFAGEYLTIKGRSLADAAYESLWYNMSPSQSKIMLFIIVRAQKQMTITAGGVTNLSLEAFASIMKALASYVSIFNAMY